MYIKTKPYHYKNSAILLGDSAHAMVPFYGQGLNCGLEDVRVFSTFLQRAGVPNMLGDSDALSSTLSKVFEEYSTTRYDDVCAMTDLAREN
jgi:kynurenine 3-monooxygenase